MAIVASDVQREEIKCRVGVPELAVADPNWEGIHGTPDATMKQVLALTRELFAGKIRVYDAEDPEIPGDRYHVFEVTAEGDVDELLAWDDQWHRRLCQLPDRIPGQYRLCIVTE